MLNTIKKFVMIVLLNVCVINVVLANIPKDHSWAKIKVDNILNYSNTSQEVSEFSINDRSLMEMLYLVQNLTVKCY